MSVASALSFLDRHKGVAALLGAFGSTTAAATWWLATGGAAALLSSLSALSDPEIAATISGLPGYHNRVETALADVRASQTEQRQMIQQIADALESFRAEQQTVVEWAPEHSQRLTDAGGGCFAGQDCTVYFRGRRTQSGAACMLKAVRPRLVLPVGDEVLVTLAPGYEIPDFGTEFETVPVVFQMPGFLEPGVVGVVVLSFYAECPFAKHRIVERETFQLLVEVKPTPEPAPE